MEIKRVDRYIFDGIEYKSLQEIQDVVHNVIGEEVVDEINRVAPLQQHKDFIKILEVLCSPEVRKVLKKYYSITFERECEYGIGEEINILDL